MKYITVKEAAAKWDISIQMVRKYCRYGKIRKAIHEENGWLIPEDAERPGAPSIEEAPVPDVVRRILYQKVRNNHFGLYEYLQVNLAYSSCRMASNRLTRTQVLDLYRTDKLGHNFESGPFNRLGTSPYIHFCFLTYFRANERSWILERKQERYSKNI